MKLAVFLEKIEIKKKIIIMKLVGLKVISVKEKIKLEVKRFHF